MVSSEPPFTGARVSSQLVAPASPQASNPVPMSSAVPFGQYGLGGTGQPAWIGAPQLMANRPTFDASQTSRGLKLTLTGARSSSNAMFPLIDPGGAGFTHAMNWSLYIVQTHLGNS